VALLLRSFVEGAPLPDLIDGPIAASMREIGALWQHRSEGIFLEHRATEICLRALYRLEALLPEPPPRPTAVGGAPAGDPYRLPTLSVATCLRAEGMHAVNLGAQVPANSFLDALQAHDAALIWISISVEMTREIEQLVETIAEQAMAAGSSLLIGGRTHAQLRNLDRPGVERGSSMRELTAFARGLVAALRQRERADFTRP
jgi:methanogenic corrinoid protein MtbC1